MQEQSGSESVAGKVQIAGSCAAFLGLSPNLDRSLQRPPDPDSQTKPDMHGIWFCVWTWWPTACGMTPPTYFQEQLNSQLVATAGFFN